MASQFTIRHGNLKDGFAVRFRPAPHDKKGRFGPVLLENAEQFPGLYVHPLHVKGQGNLLFRRIHTADGFLYLLCIGHDGGDLVYSQIKHNEDR